MMSGAHSRPSPRTASKRPSSPAPITSRSSSSQIDFRCVPPSFAPMAMSSRLSLMRSPWTRLNPAPTSGTPNARIGASQRRVCSPRAGTPRRSRGAGCAGPRHDLVCDPEGVAAVPQGQVGSPRHRRAALALRAKQERAGRYVRRPQVVPSGRLSSYIDRLANTREEAPAQRVLVLPLVVAGPLVLPVRTARVYSEVQVEDPIQGYI
jgi:hypothetical protein